MLKILAYCIVMLGAVPALAQEKPAVGDRIGDWVFQCEARAEGQTDCALVQTIVNDSTKKAIAQLRILAPREPGQGVMTALVPLGLDLQKGLEVTLDGAEPLAAPLSTCLARGCIAQIRITPEVAAKLKAGSKLNMTFDLLTTRQRITLNGSLSGISAAFFATGWY